MQVKDIMTAIGGTINPDTSFREASERFKALGVDLLPVCSEDGIVVGLLSEQALYQQAAQDGLAVGSHLVYEAMTAEIICCSADDDTSDAFKLVQETLREDSRSGIPVTDASKRLIGIVLLADLRKHSQLKSGETFLAASDGPVSASIHYDDDRVDHISDASFPASDPLPPPSTLGPDEHSPKT
ncbi:MAG: hypothetical protein NVSMB52_17270 [Chloroflexota bacterium]